MADEIGTISVGKRADLVVLDGDPLRDIEKTRRIEYVVLNGVIRRPADILEGAPPSDRQASTACTSEAPPAARARTPSEEPIR